jgi:hypothetical protein
VSFLSSPIQIVDTALQLALIVLLLRGPYRRYPTLFVFSIASLIITIVEFVYIHTPHYSVPFFRRLYWSDEVITDLLLFLLVITLTNLALEGSSQRPKMSRVLLGIVAVALLLPFVILNPPFAKSGLHWSAEWGHWFTSTSQMLNFGAAIMNLALWSALLTSRNRDRQLLRVSIGVGIAVAGQAIGFGMRRFTQQDTTARDVSAFFMLITHLLSVLIWCWAFRSKAKPTTPK